MSIKLMTRVWDETRFKGTELLVLLCLADHANDEGTCWPSYTKIALRARCSRRHAIRIMENLRAEGWVKIVGHHRNQNGQATNLFRIQAVTKRGDAHVTPNSEKGERGDILTNRGDTGGRKEVTPMSPKPSGEPPIESDFISFEQSHQRVMEITTLNAIQAVTCVSRWMEESAHGATVTSLDDFAANYVP